MKFDIITIFPHVFDSYLNESMIKRAKSKKLVDIKIHDLRSFSRDKHRKVDDRPYGGGPGMVLKAEPIVRAIQSLLKPSIFNFQFSIFKRRTKIVLFSASGKQFNAKTASDWAKKYERIIMIAGHYEGVDERIKKVIENCKLKIENLSIGPYVLTGGELPAMVVVDAVSRHIPGVLGKEESLEEKRYGVGVPVYTRPEVFEWPAFASTSAKATADKKTSADKKGKKYAVPKVLLSGDYAKVKEWRKKHV